MSAYDLLDSSVGGLVVNTGGYSGGGQGSDVLAMFDFGNVVSEKLGVTHAVGGLIVVLVMMLIVFFLWNPIVSMYASLTGFENMHPHNLRSAIGHSQPSLERFSMADRPGDWLARKSAFMNGREQPYFPDVTNRVLRMENREKEAVRALGKINQERLRRAAEDSSSTTPLPWGPFWDEWKQTHVMDGEDVAEGFESKFERSLDHSSPY
jgi:hypothetical protein